MNTYAICTNHAWTACPLIADAEVAAINADGITYEEGRARYAALAARYTDWAVGMTKAKGIQVPAFKEFTVVDGVTCIGVGCIDALVLGGKNWAETAEEQAIVDGMTVRCMKALNATFYASEKEGFFLWKAAEQAKAEGKRYAFCENLS